MEGGDGRQRERLRMMEETPINKATCILTMQPAALFDVDH